MSTVLDGRKVRDSRMQALSERVNALSVTPKLVIVRVGEREDTAAFVRQKQQLGEKLGVEVAVEHFSGDIGEDELLLAIGELNHTPGVHGVIVQLPLPEHLDVFRVIEAVEPTKDADGLTAINLKKLLLGRSDGVVPATARGIRSLLSFYEIEPHGKRAAVIGRSMLVGKPTAHMLLNANATVTIAHSNTADLAEVTRRADILVVAAGSPELINDKHVTEHQTVIDVGMNRLADEEAEERGQKFIGDVSYTAVVDHVEAITPVPGGVGPLTVLSLFENLVDLCEQAYNADTA